MSELTKNQLLAMLKDTYIKGLLDRGMISVTQDGCIINNNWRGLGYSKEAKQTLQKNGYLHACLPGRVTAQSSRVVAIAFHGMPDGYKEASHKNGISTDNSPANLVWLTPMENTRHSFAAGFNKPLQRGGEKNGRAKLTKRDVRKIRKLLSSGEKPEVIAKKFKVSPRAIYSIKNGECWK